MDQHRLEIAPHIRDIDSGMHQCISMINTFVPFNLVVSIRLQSLQQILRL